MAVKDGWQKETYGAAYKLLWPGHWRHWAFLAIIAIAVSICAALCLNGVRFAHQVEKSHRPFPQYSHRKL